MKIKKTDEKPMVIHTKKKQRIHLHTEKKHGIHLRTRKKSRIHPHTKKKFGKISVLTQKEKRRSHYRDRHEKSALSVKFRNQSLKVLAAGVRSGAGQIEGGEEIKDSIALAATLSAPALGITSKAGQIYRKKRTDKQIEKRERSHAYTNREYAVSSIHARKNDRIKKKHGRENGKKRVNGIVRRRMWDAFIEKFRADREEQKNLVTSAKEAAKAAAHLLLKRMAAAVAPFLLIVFTMIAIAGTIVAAILAVIYNSPLAVFFPLPDTGYENPRTVLLGYYEELNSQLDDLKEQGYVINYQNSKDGVPISNFNDTLVVYMVRYGMGQAACVMDEDGKKNLKEVFDEMNYYDKSGSTTEVLAGESLGEVVTTGYCSCVLCCGKWAGGHTASGTVPKANHTLAVDAASPKVPMGTEIVMNGITYKVEDTGNFARYGTDFDIYFDKHEEALAWGKRKVVAYLAEGNENTVEITVPDALVHNLIYEDYIALDKLTEEQTEWMNAIMSGAIWEDL